MVKRTLAGSVVALALVLASCASTAPIVLIDYEADPADPALTARISGVLTTKDGCLYIVPPGGPAVLPVFRPGAVPTEAVGDEVVLGGGFAPKPAIDSLREYFDIPSSCGTEAGIFLAAVQEH